MKRYFLGTAADFSRKERLSHTFSCATRKDIENLEEFLAKKYNGEAIALKNGRSALACALMSYLPRGSEILVNGFTCFAVIEAIRAAEMKPVFVDISKEDLNFTVQSLEDALERTSGAKGIIVQNTFGNPVDIKKIEKFAHEHHLVIFEDLAHAAGIKYADGREAGTVGAATVLSFGKDKTASAISGGAVILRAPAVRTYPDSLAERLPRLSDRLRARFYPLFGAIYRGLTAVRLEKIWMGLLLKIHWVEKSADNRLDLSRTIAPFEAKTALRRLKKLDGRPLREFYFVKNRKETLKRLSEAGYFCDGFWYEKPVAPERYYKKVDFPEASCPNAVYAAKHVVNLPNYYKKSDLERARKIIREGLDEA